MQNNMRNVSRKLIFTFIIILALIEKVPAARDVSNEEIRDAILSLVHSYNLLDNKLERHEHRERALGEIVKRALQSLQKGQKAYEPMNGIFSRLDERVSQIETMLIAQEDKYNVQTDKLSESLQNIFKWMAQNSACHKPGGGIGGPPGIENRLNQELDDKIEKLSKNIKDLTKISKDLLDQTEKLITIKSTSNDEVITKLEDKLQHFYVTSPVTQPSITKRDTEFEDHVKLHLNQIETNIAALKEIPKTSDKLTEFDKEFLQGLSNETLREISNVRRDLSVTADKVNDKTSSEFKLATSNLDLNMNKILTNLADSSDITQKLYNDVNQSYSNLRENFEVFNKFDKILLTTSDYVLDTQRKIEFGTHQILQKVGELIRLQYDELNTTLQKRFNDIDNSIINNHLEALQNLSSTMESEISHVWRQIEIMHSELSYSKDALNKLQGQTEQYVNGSMTVMDSMTGKVSHITERMSEVDSNLNYLLGKLSLVTQEFNQIKIGLGSALDQIRNSFKTVQDKIKDVGPGPHEIPRNEYETDINLLPQRDSPAN